MSERIESRDPDTILREYEELTVDLREDPELAAKRVGVTLKEIRDMYAARKRRLQRQQAAMERAAGYHRLDTSDWGDDE